MISRSQSNKNTGGTQLTVTEQVQQSLQKNDNAKALSLAQSEYDKNKTADNARLVAQVYAADGKYQDVITTLDSLGASNLTYVDYQQLGIAYEKSGNIPAAAAAYRKAADLWPTTDSGYDSETTYFRNYANYLEGHTDGM